MCPMRQARVERTTCNTQTQCDLLNREWLLKNRTWFPEKRATKREIANAALKGMQDDADHTLKDSRDKCQYRLRTVICYGYSSR